MKFLGFELKREKRPELESFDMSKELTSTTVIPDYMLNDGYGINAMAMDSGLSTTPTEEYDLIRQYRELATSSEIDEAMTEIRNEIFIFDVPGKKAFEIDWTEECDLREGMRRKIEAEFDYLYHLVEFDHKGVQMFDDWFVDSRLVLQKIIDKNRPREGLKAVTVIDPMKIRQVRVLPKPDQTTGEFDLSKVQEFYLYNQFDPRQYPINQVIQMQYGQALQGQIISKDSVAYIHSGNFDRNMGRYVGYLKKAICPYNNLKMMEDAMVIFRVVRAPARRAFYIDVSDLQKNKAEAYMKNLMAKFKSKMTYDSKTGSLADRRNIMSMTEDYWLPRRDGARGTEIQTIEGQSSQDIMEEIEYLRDKLWRALNVPRSRFGDQQSTFVFGKGIEIQRDEYRFTKYLHLLRSRFILFMEDLLRTQLILKNIIVAAEWDEIRRGIVWEYTEDNAFVEWKESEIINNKLDTLSRIDPFVGRYFSIDWVRRNVVRQTDEDIKTEDAQIKKEKPMMDQWRQDQLEAEENAHPEAAGGF